MPKFRRDKNFVKKSPFKRSEDYSGDKGDAKPNDNFSVNDLIAKVAAKDLPQSSYNFPADPYTEINQPSTTYHLLSSFNKRFNTSYGGKANLNGGNVAQYLDSYTSGMLDVFDMVSLGATANYRYLPIKSTYNSDTNKWEYNHGKKMVDKYINNIATGMSQLDSTTYTTLAFNSYYVVTTLPMGDATSPVTVTDVTENVPTGGAKVSTTFKDVPVYLDKSPVMYSTSIVYQLILQSINDIVGKINKFRAYQKTCNMMGWQRELTALLTLQGQFNKTAFLNLVDSLTETLQGEYFDHEWSKQYSTLNISTSRRSHSMYDPLLELDLVHAFPSVFQLRLFDAAHKKTVDGVEVHDYDKDIVVFSSNSALTSINYDVVDGARTEVVKYYTIPQIVTQFADALSLINVQTWARKSLDGTAIFTYNEWYNIVVQHIHAVNLWMTGFKTAMADYRTALDTVSRTGIVTWVKGFRPQVTSITNLVPEDFVLIEDVYRNLLVGMNKLQFDESTQRIRGFSMWNTNSGIPAFDAYQAGIILAASTKDISDVDTSYLPVMLNLETKSVTEGGNTYNYLAKAVNRKGILAYINYDVISTPRANDKLARLFPLVSQTDDHAIRVPKVLNTASFTDVMVEAQLDKIMLQLFMIAKDNNGNIMVHPDIYAVYDYEVDDITNAVINYVAKFSVFRGSSNFADDIIGFLGGSK